MAFVTKRPQLEPDSVWGSKEARGILGVSPTQMRRYRDNGYIERCNDNYHRPKYTGKAIMRCWDMVAYGFEVPR